MIKAKSRVCFKVASNLLIDKQKDCIRQDCLQKRHRLGNAVRQTSSKIIAEKLIEQITHKNSLCIGAFAPMAQEVNIWSVLDFCKSKQIEVFLPRIVSFRHRELVFHPFSCRHELIENSYGILQPSPQLPCVKPQNFDFLIVPAVAIDYQKKRLGYGGGFYDKLLSDLPQVFSCAPIFYCQWLADVPQNSFDQTVSLIITEKNFP